MKLFHFCKASDLDSIAEKDLYPHVALRAGHVVAGTGRVAD